MNNDSENRWVEEAKLEAHSDWVRDTAWAPRCCIKILTFICTSKEGRMLESFTICYSALCFSLSIPLPSLGPGRQTLASCSQDRRVIIWTQKDGGAWTPK